MRGSVPPTTRSPGRVVRVPDCSLRKQSTHDAVAQIDAFSGCGHKPFQFHVFDANYVESLCSGDLATQEHFVQYFTELMHLKLRSRLRSPQAVEDIRQETFARVFACLRRENFLRQPERLGAFVNTVCSNVLSEHYRLAGRAESLEAEDHPEPMARTADASTVFADRQLHGKVREILLSLPARDRAILKAIFLDERDRADVCREFAVDREYLRVLLHRAKQEFKVEFVRRMGRDAYGLYL